MEGISPQPAAFRLRFSDGDGEIDVGEVVVDPSFTFKEFQILVSDMIGFSPHQIVLFLLRQRKARSGRSRPGTGRRTPIDEGTDFARVVCESGGAVLAQLRRTRRERRGRGRRNRITDSVGDGAGGFFAREERIQRGQEGYRRSTAAAAMGGGAAPEKGAGFLGLLNNESLRNLQLQRERYLLSAAAAAAAYYPYAVGAAPHANARDPTGLGGGGTLAGAAAVSWCGVCSAAGDRPGTPFHWCVYDRVLAEGFRSSAGPIQRPPASAVRAPA